MISKNWCYDEFKQVGKDYGDWSEVSVYESSHAQFRDILQESQEVLNRLNLTEHDVLVDFGCGTGIFAIESAQKCRKVYAVDVSREMLSYAKKKATSLRVKNIEFFHSGFLNFEIENESVDFITTIFSFHHLPDYWKGIALQQMCKMLKKGGIVYIKDVVISEADSLSHIQSFIDTQTKLGGDFLKEDAEVHFKEEFSTYDWILEGLVHRAGFKIESKKNENGVLAEYYCKKE